MCFVDGFMKTAALDRHNDGTEFKRNDTEPMAFRAGPGGMAPSGFYAFEPTGKPLKNKEDKDLDAATIVYGKLASSMEGSDGYGAEHTPMLDYTGKKQDAASTVATQLSEKGLANMSYGGDNEVARLISDQRARSKNEKKKRRT